MNEITLDYTSNKKDKNIMTRKLGGITISSSADPKQLSLTITSLIRLIISALVGFGVLSATGADTTLEQIPVIVTAGVTAWETIQLIYGAVRKVLMAFSHEE